MCIAAVGANTLNAKQFLNKVLKVISETSSWRIPLIFQSNNSNTWQKGQYHDRIWQRKL